MLQTQRNSTKTGHDRCSVYTGQLGSESVWVRAVDLSSNESITSSNIRIGFSCRVKEAYKVWNYRNPVDVFANNCCTGNYLHEIAYFRLCDWSEIPNTEQNFHKLSYHRPENGKIPNTVVSNASPWKHQVRNSSPVCLFVMECFCVLFGFEGFPGIRKGSWHELRTTSARGCALV